MLLQWIGIGLDRIGWENAIHSGSIGIGGGGEVQCKFNPYSTTEAMRVRMVKVDGRITKIPRNETMSKYFFFVSVGREG